MDTLAQIALTLIPGLGPTGCHRLLDIVPNDDLFAMSHAQLVELFGTHNDIIAHIEKKSTFARAEAELRFVEQNGLHVLFYTDEAFPQRMKQPETADCPVLLYMQGEADLNAERTVAVVGTRRATAYGRDNTDRLVRQLSEWQTPVVSGLAYGIDTAAHTAAIEHGVATVAVLGHGLDRIYPPQNRRLAERILEHGGALLTEYPSGTAINPRYFPARNRIIAALSDATVVVEASEKGGALITAAIAASYHREVFAVPGRLTDTYSTGTNNLIATNKALLVRTADDIAFQMGWPMASQQAKGQQPTLFATLGKEEQRVVDMLREYGHLSLDEIASMTGASLPKTAALMFNLEMQEVVHALPGRLYQLCCK